MSYNVGNITKLTIYDIVDCRNQLTKAVYKIILTWNHRKWSQGNENVFFITTNELPEAARETNIWTHTPNSVHVPKIDSLLRENSDDPPSY